jgi:2-oxoglutarate ferredoxin oxidoreductase subunit beta
MNEEGYSFVEILAPCPTNWGISVEKCLKRLKEEVIPFFSCGEIIKGRTRA